MIFIHLFFLAQMAFTQEPIINDPSRASLNALRREGKLVSIQLIPKKPIQIFVVGKEVANFDPKELKLVVKKSSPRRGMLIRTEREGDHFIISEPLDTPTDLEITAKTPKQSETFHFKISNELR